MGEQFGNFFTQYPWQIMCVVSFLCVAGQIGWIYIAKQRGWAFRFNPIRIIVFILLFFFSIYAMITGQRF